MNGSAAVAVAPAPRRPWWLRGRAGLGLALAALMLGLAIGAPLWAPADPAAAGPAADRLLAPSLHHPLGTDLLGRDVLVRVIHGSRASLLIGWVSVTIALLIGTVVGLVAGLGPRPLGRALMAVTDVFLAFPRIFLILLLVSLTRPSLGLTLFVLAATGWMGVARLVRAEVLGIRERDYVAAARGLGLGPWRIAWSHVLPNVMPTVVITVALRVGNVILMETFLGFLGLGVQEPTVSWGLMIQHGRGHLLDGWWLSTFPGLAIALTVIGYNLLGDGLREHLDPRRRRGGGS